MARKTLPFRNDKTLNLYIYNLLTLSFLDRKHKTRNYQAKESPIDGIKRRCLEIPKTIHTDNGLIHCKELENHSDGSFH